MMMLGSGAADVPSDSHPHFRVLPTPLVTTNTFSLNIFFPSSCWSNYYTTRKGKKKDVDSRHRVSKMVLDSAPFFILVLFVFPHFPRALARKISAHHGQPSQRLSARQTPVHAFLSPAGCCRAMLVRLVLHAPKWATPTFFLSCVSGLSWLLIGCCFLAGTFHWTWQQGCFCFLYLEMVFLNSGEAMMEVRTGKLFIFLRLHLVTLFIVYKCIRNLFVRSSFCIPVYSVYQESYRLTKAFILLYPSILKYKSKGVSIFDDSG